ncbi:hypothetical protein KA977_05755 [Candidatus Dependentiae bacterium]|nr:hypothetical protein [Candidatus Dependentiae bacterium]
MFSNVNDSKLYTDFEHFADDIYFAKYLKFKKYFDDSTYVQFRAVQELSNKKLGEIAVEKKFITPNVAESLYDEGVRLNKYFGEIAVEKNILTVEQVEKIVEEQKKNFIGIGELVVDFGYIRQDKLLEEMKNFQESQKKTNTAIDEKISKIDFKYVKPVLNTIIITLTRILFMPPKLTSLIQPVNAIYPMDKLYRFAVSKDLNFDIFFNYDEKFVNELFIFKFRNYRNKRLLKLRNAIPQEISNILTGVIVKNLCELNKIDLNMSIPYPITDQKYELSKEHHKFSIASPSGKVEIILQTSK